MKFSEYLLSIVEAKKKYCFELKFSEDDVRADFHGMIHDLLHNYYCGLIVYELSLEIKNGNVCFNENLIDLKIHIDRLIDVVAIPILSISYLSSLNKQFSIGIWTSFELSVTIIAETVLDEKEKQELLSIKNDEIMKILKDKKIDEETLTKISKKLLDNHITHTPLVRKFRKILNHYEGKYSRDIQDDIRFLEFYGKMRNTLMHSNGIYYGKLYEFEFKNYIFKFENGKIFTYTEDKEMPLRVYIELASNLSLIYVAITNLLSDIKEIKYPDTGVYWAE